MANMRERAARAARRRHRHAAGETIVYSAPVVVDDVETTKVVELTAIPTTANRDKAGPKQNLRLVVQDFVLEVAELRAAEIPLPPERGHQVFWNGQRYDAAIPDGDDDVWRWKDHDQSQIRLHTQLTSDPFGTIDPPAIT